MLANTKEWVRRKYLKYFKHIEIIDLDLEPKLIEDLIEFNLIEMVGEKEFKFTPKMMMYFESSLKNYKETGKLNPE